MKKCTCLALALVLTAGLLVGCGCTGKKMEPTVAPTVLPTNEEIWNSTQATTRATTEPTRTTEDMVPGTTIDRGNGPLEDDMTGTTNPGETADSRTRQGILDSSSAGTGSRMR